MENKERLVHNYFQSIGRPDYVANDIEVLSHFANYLDNKPEEKKHRVALCFICVNEPYWQYIKDAIGGARKYFLPGHDVDMFLWSDITLTDPDSTYGAKVFEIEPVEWPFPTLMRYNLFLQQEEILKEYDYIFYCDIDMRFVGIVGDEILGDGLTGAQHPMYAFRKEYYFPLEPNPESKAFIKMPRYYFAGGFQGGKAKDFIKAMKVMRKTIDDDFKKNYIARWNDESHWNKYLFDNPPAIVLSPSYVYPDSLINEYYVKVWGCNYPPKIITLTKKFSTTVEGGQAIQDMLKTL